MNIEFTNDAGESFDTAVARLSTYVVEITTEAGEKFDAEMIGPDTAAGWHGTVLVKRWHDGGSNDSSYGKTISVVAKSIKVY